LKKALSVSNKRELVAYAKAEYKVSLAQVCRSLKLNRSSYYYQAVAPANDEVADKLLELTSKHKKYGYRKLYQKLRQEGRVVNHKKVHRLYKKHQLNLRVKLKKRVKVDKKPLAVPTAPQQNYALDFVHDRLANGRKIRILNIVDEFNSKAVSLDVDWWINSQKVIEVLKQLGTESYCQQLLRVIMGENFVVKQSKIGAV
jgi:putative transposase